jgi:hypothetical protein
MWILRYFQQIITELEDDRHILIEILNFTTIILVGGELLYEVENEQPDIHDTKLTDILCKVCKRA